MKKRLEFRGISQKLIIEYITSITNISSSHIITNGDDSVTINSNLWSVIVTKEETFTYSHTISFPRLLLTFEGDEKLINELIQGIRNRTIRLGG